MKHKRLVAVLAVTMAVAGTFVGSTGTASGVPTAPVYLIDPGFGNSVLSEAINVQASGGILIVAPTLDTKCVGPTAPIRQDLAVLPLGTLANVKALHGECNIAPHTDLSAAKAKITSIDLLNGAIDITGIVSKCTITKTGEATCGSVVSQLNGKDVALGPISIVLPGLAAIYFDHNTETVDVTGATTMSTTAVEVDLFPVVVGGVVVRKAEQIVIGRASITTPGG
jgi:hypothetical protein